MHATCRIHGAQDGQLPEAEATVTHGGRPADVTTTPGGITSFRSEGCKGVRHNELRCSPSNTKQTSSARIAKSMRANWHALRAPPTTRAAAAGRSPCRTEGGSRGWRFQEVPTSDARRRLMALERGRLHGGTGGIVGYRRPTDTFGAAPAASPHSSTVPSVVPAAHGCASHTAYWKPLLAILSSLPLARTPEWLGDQSPGPILMATLSSINAAYTSAADFLTTTLDLRSGSRRGEGGGKSSGTNPSREDKGAQEGRREMRRCDEGRSKAEELIRDPEDRPHVAAPAGRANRSS